MATFFPGLPLQHVPAAVRPPPPSLAPVQTPVTSPKAKSGGKSRKTRKTRKQNKRRSSRK